MKTEYKISKQTLTIEQKEEVQKSNDEHIDQDFEGYPHSPASDNIINPKSAGDKITAGVKGGENITHEAKEIESDGSANAFERTEGMSGQSEGKHEKPKIDEKGKVY
jgi:hypothetical protein